jgi:hypothetical protein
MESSHLSRNQAALQRLAELAARLTEEDLARSLGGGWTIKAALAHLAFWDRYASALLDDWSAHGFQPVAASPDHINAGALADWLALDPEHVRREAVAAAQAVDQRVEAVGAGLAEAMMASGRGRMLDRSVHRNAHCDQIEEALPA